MAYAVVMPKAGITVEECIIGKWQKKVGDQVKIGDILFTYETDKAAFECESTAEGELLEVFFGDGDEVPVLVNVCVVGSKGEETEKYRPSIGNAAPAEAAATPAETPVAPTQETSPAPVVIPAATDGTGNAISPRAKNLAIRSGVNAAQATATGPHGRIIERDVRRLMEEQPAVTEISSAPAESASPAAADVAYTDETFSTIRRAIAKSMSASLSTIPQLTHTHSFDASEIKEYRKKLKASEGDTAGITLGDIILYAVSRTILAYPALNANVIADNKIRKFSHVNLGVAMDTPRGLVVPTIFNADTMSLLEISKAVKKLAAEAREGTISPDLLHGASFTVSNLGNLGVESFTPVINPPQTGILGVCAMQTRVRDVDGLMAMYPAMTLSLTYDHRAIDGSPASKFMRELCSNLEHFVTLLAR